MAWSSMGIRGLLLPWAVSACWQTDNRKHRHLLKILQAPAVAPTRVRQRAVCRYRTSFNCTNSKDKQAQSKKTELPWKRLVKSANQKGGSNSLSEISGVLLRIFHPFSRLCVWPLTHRPAWIILSGCSQERADSHPRLARQQRGCLLNTVAGYHGNKMVGRQLWASDLVGVHSILCEVLLVKLWDTGSHWHQGGHSLNCDRMMLIQVMT